MERSESKMRNMALRKNIRRAELDNYFQQRRRDLLQEVVGQESTFTIMFNSPEERERFLAESSLQLTGDAKPEWLHTVTRLRKALLAFKDDFDQWFSYSIMQRLCSCLTIDLPDELTDNIILIFIDMLFFTIQHDTDFASRLMEYEIIPPVITLASDKNRPLISRLHATMLLSKIIYIQPQYRYQIVRDGAGSVIVEQAHEIAQSPDLTQYMAITLLEACRGFLKTHKSMNIVAFHMTLVYSITPHLLNLFLNEKLDDRTLLLVIQNLNFVLAVAKDNIYTLIYYTRGFQQRMFSLLYSDKTQIRNCVCLMVGYMAYSDSEKINKDLIGHGMIDHLYSSYNRFQSNNREYTRNMINAVYNVMQTEANCQVIARHSICEAIVSKFSNEEPADLQLEAVYFINTLMQNLRYSLLEQVIKRYNIFMVLARNLMDFNAIDVRITNENLESFISVVRRSQEVYHGGDNPIVKNLETLYNLSETAENIRNNTSNKLIETSAETLTTIIHQTYLQNADTVI